MIVIILFYYISWRIETYKGIYESSSVQYSIQIEECFKRLVKWYTHYLRWRGEGILLLIKVINCY